MPYKDPDKQRKYQRERNAKRRADWLAKNGPCIKCKATERLEIDHIDRATKVSHTVWSWSEEKRLAELSKCQVLCYECHKAKTKKELSPGIRHGTHTGYATQGCRCNKCKQAQHDYQVQYRLKVPRKPALPFTGDYSNWANK